jgi:thymidylate kinase
MARGRFIVLEGLDRSGKSTQVERLVKRLNAKLQKFPGESEGLLSDNGEMGGGREATCAGRPR